MSTTRTTTITTRKKKIYLMIILILSIILATCFFVFQKDKVNVVNDKESDYHTYTYQGKTYRYNADIVSLLFLGIDTTDTSENQGQSDAIELVLLDRENETIKLLTIPRDTMTDIKTYDYSGKLLGWSNDHITLAYAYGTDSASGCMNSADAISRMLNNVPVNYYSAMNLSDLKEFQSIVGELEVVVPNDSASAINPSWTTGSTITINEDNVESYVRKRDTDEDFSAYDRVERQESYLKAYIAKLKEILNSDFDNAIDSLEKLFSGLYTNISTMDLIDYANMLISYQFDTNTDIFHIPGENKRGKVYDEYIIDNSALEEMIVKLFYEERGA